MPARVSYVRQSLQGEFRVVRIAYFYLGYLEATQLHVTKRHLYKVNYVSTCIISQLAPPIIFLSEQCIALQQILFASKGVP